MDMKYKIDKIISESIDKVLTERFDSNILRDIYKSSPSYKTCHGLNNFDYKNLNYDMETPDIINTRDSLDTKFYLSKITDDMIEAVGTLEELGNLGYTIIDNKMVDSNYGKHYAISLRGGKYIVFKNDERTINKMRQLSTSAGEQYKSRQANKRHDGKYDYQWSTKDRGSAYHDWKTTAPLWDSEEFRKKPGVNVPKDWRQKESWLGNNMRKALDSYKKK